MALNKEGTLLATASEQGTLIRIFNTKTGDKVSELRRGSTPTQISDLAFDQESKFLTCCSNKGTVHLFKITAGGEEKAASGNTKSYFGMIGSIIPLASSEWSFA